MSADSKFPWRAWLPVALLFVVGCLNYLDRVMITTMRESVKAEIPMTEAQFGLLTTLFVWVYGVLSPFAGFFADRCNRARIIVVSLFVWSVVTWMTAHAKSYDQLLLTRALMGISEASYIPAALALIADYHRGPTRSLANGIHLGGAILGSSLGGLGGVLAEDHGWQFPFSCFGLVGVVYGVALILWLREPPRERDAAGPAANEPRVSLLAALASLFSQGSFLIAVAFWGLLAIAGWGILGWMPSYLGEQFQLPQGRAGLLATGCVNGAMLVGLVLCGAWADRWSRTHARGRIFVPIIGLCVAAPAVWFAASTSWLWGALVGLVIYGVARASADSNMMPILCLIVDSRYRATGYGILNLFGSIVGGLTIYIGGALRDAHVDVARVFQFAGAGLVLCAGLLVFIRPRATP